eukprot:m.48984 g.48984  ORF g.48984 m.48984 type:complete len:452 (-) comp13337_c0_seq2:77-1432(-)
MAAYRLASQDGFVGSQTRTNRHDQSQPTLEHKLALVKQEKHDLQLRLLQLEDRAQDADLLQQENNELRHQLAALETELQSHLGQPHLDSPSGESNHPPSQDEVAALSSYARQIETLQREVASVLAENDRLSSENRRLATHVDDEKDFDDLEAVTEQLIVDNKQLKAALDDKEVQFVTLQQQLHQAEDELAQRRAEHRVSHTADRVDRQELSTLRETNSRLSRQVIELEQSLTRLKDDQSYHYNARERSSVQDPVVARTAAQYDKILQDQAQQHQEELAVVTRQLGKERAKLADKQTQYEELVSRANEVTTLMKELKRRLDHVTQAKADAEQRASQAEIELDDSKAQQAAFTQHLAAAIEVADKRQRQLTTLIAVAESSRRERDVALRNAATRDAELHNLTHHLQQQESEVREKLLTAVELVKSQGQAMSQHGQQVEDAIAELAERVELADH